MFELCLIIEFLKNMKFSTEQADNIVIFTLKNKTINSEIAPELKAQLLILCQPEIEALIIDLQNVDNIDSSGIGAFLLAQRQMNEYGLPIILAGVNPIIISILQMLHLEELFDIFPSVEEAIKELNEEEEN